MSPTFTTYASGFGEIGTKVLLFVSRTSRPGFSSCRSNVIAPKSVCALALPLLGLLGGRVVEKPQNCKGVVGIEVFEDIGTVRESACNQVEDYLGQLVDGAVVSFCWLLESGNVEERVSRPDVRAHEEAAGENKRGVRIKRCADVVTLKVWENQFGEK